MKFICAGEWRPLPIPLQCTSLVDDSVDAYCIGTYWLVMKLLAGPGRAGPDGQRAVPCRA